MEQKTDQQSATQKIGPPDGKKTGRPP